MTSKPIHTPSRSMVNDPTLCTCGHHGISHGGSPNGHCTMCTNSPNPCPAMQTLRISPFLAEALSDLADNFRDADLDGPADELDALVNRLRGAMCMDCGTIGKCPCDAMADQQMTGGY